MCLIVDANLAALIFSVPPRDDFQPVIEWLTNKDGKLVVGGHLAVELNKGYYSGVVKKGEKGWPEKASEMASIIRWPFLRAVEM